MDLKALGHIFTGEDFYLPKGEVWGAPDTEMTMSIKKRQHHDSRGVYFIIFSTKFEARSRGHGIAQFTPSHHGNARLLKD